MSVNITELNNGATLELAVTGKLHKQDYEKRMAAFCRAFTSGKVRCFDRTEKADAMEWLTEGFEESA